MIVRDAPEDGRFEAIDDQVGAEDPRAEATDTTSDGGPARRAEGPVVGFLAYDRGAGLVTLVHTEVDPAYRRAGVAADLVRVALDDARARGVKVVPVCPYVAHYLDRHPDDADLDARPRRDS